MENKGNEMEKEAPSKRSAWSLNYEMLPYKIHFFFFCGAASGVFPFQVVFAEHKLGLTATEVAMLFTTQQFLFIVSKTALGAIVDYFNKMKVVLIVITILQALFYTLFLVIPPIRSDLVENSSIEQKITSPAYNITSEDNTTSSEYVNFDCYLCINRPSVFSEAKETFIFLSTQKQAEKETAYLLQCHLDYHETRILLNNGKRYRCSDTLDVCDINENVMNYTFTTCTIQPAFTDGDAFQVVDVNVGDIELPQCHDDYQQELNECHRGGVFLKPIPPKIHQSVYTSYKYWLAALCLICGGITSNALYTLSDTACYESLQKTNSDYGRQRLWGAISWGLLSPLAGYLNDLFSTDTEPNYVPGFCLMLVLSLMQIINLYRMDLVKPHSSKNLFKHIRIMFSSKEFVLFEFGVFSTGVFTAIIWFYLMVYLVSIGGSRLLLGLVQTCQCFLGEVPLMFFSGWLVNKFGHLNTLIITLLSFSFRFFCYSFLKNPWYVLPVECMHGLSYGLFYAAMTSYGKLSALPGTEATTQAVLCSTFEGLGVGVGSLVVGIGFDQVGSKQTMFLAAIICVGVVAVYTLIMLSLKRRQRTLELKPIDK